MTRVTCPWCWRRVRQFDRTGIELHDVVGVPGKQCDGTGRKA